MVDETPTGVAPNPVHPTTQPGHTFMTSSTAEPKAAKVDHLGFIEELVRDLHNITPSGAETVRDKILQHIADIRDPKAYDERMAKEKKAHDEAAAVSKKAKEEALKAREAEKVYVKVA
jgi:hypothetical protein